jgi:hypothetical protein
MLRRISSDKLLIFPTNLVNIKPQLRITSNEMETLVSGVLHIFKGKHYYTEQH